MASRGPGVAFAQLKWSARPPGPNVPMETLLPESAWRVNGPRHSFLCRSCKVVLIEYAHELSERQVEP